MKKRLFSFLLVLFTVAFYTATASHQGRIGYSNGPQETNCTQCHTTYALNSGPGSVSITSDMLNWQYVPGQTYTISLTVQQAGSPRFGFAFEANKDTGMIGTLTTMSPTDSLTTWRTRTITFEGTQHVKYGMTQSRWNMAPAGQPVQYFYPATAPDTYTWNFKWTAPLTNEGLLTFWFTGVATDDSLEWDTVDDDYTYTGSQDITPAPVPMTINCATNTSVAACQDQSAINAAFFTWLTTATVSGGCNAVLTNDATAAPLACGGSVLVTWTATSTCGANETCSATFTVDAAAPVVLNCIGNQIVPSGNGLTQATVDAAYAIWLASTNFTGGCNGVLTNNSTGGPLATGGSVTVIFTVTSACEADVTCSATFSVPVITTSQPNLLQGFNAPVGSVSVAQSFTFTANYLSDDVKLVAPPGFQISLTKQKYTWKSTITIPKDLNNQVLLTTVYVRFIPYAQGDARANIRLKTNNIIMAKMRVEGYAPIIIRNAAESTVSEMEITLAPNPVVNALNIAISNTDETTMVSLFDLTGNKLQSVANVPSGTLTLDVSNLPKGVYFCRIESANNLVVKRFVK